jgi:hypothetical protein
MQRTYFKGGESGIRNPETWLGGVQIRIIGM